MNAIYEAPHGGALAGFIVSGKSGEPSKFEQEFMLLFL